MHTRDKEITENKIYKSVQDGFTSIKLCVLRTSVVNFHFFRDSKYKIQFYSKFHLTLDNCPFSIHNNFHKVVKATFDFVNLFE